MGKRITVHASLPRFLAQQTSLLGRRIDSMRSGLDGPRRNINDECQYPEQIDLHDYKEMWQREGYGKKVVESLPNECWIVDPELYENEKKRFTPWEKSVKNLADNPDIALFSMLHQLDIRCGVGRFGVMVYGLNDGVGLDTPAFTVNEDGTTQAPEGRRLQWLKVFDQSRVEVAEVEMAPGHPRWGKPTFYDVVFEDPRTFGPATRVPPRGIVPGTKHRIHWTRVQHAADGCAPGEVLGVPRQEAVWNRLLDLRKILGGDGEMFWKGGFPGLAITADPALLEAGTVEVDEESLKEQLRLYMDGLQRYLSLVGLNANSLTTTVADPTAHVIVHLNAIACALDMPLRIFMGSEEAKVASGHDMRSWGRRVKRRQTKYIDPFIVRPCIERLIALKVIPPTKALDDNKKPKFTSEWPPIDIPNEDETSTVTDRLAAAMQKYVAGGLHELMQPTDFLRYIMKLAPEIVEEIIANAKKEPEIEFTPQNPAPVIGDDGKPVPGQAGKLPGKKGVKKGGDTGVAGDKPPSDGRKVTVK